MCGRVRNWNGSTLHWVEADSVSGFDLPAQTRSEICVAFEQLAYVTYVLLFEAESYAHKYPG